MQRAIASSFFLFLTIAACSSNSTSANGPVPKPVPPRVREPDLGITGAGASCLVDHGGASVGMTCGLRTEGAKPPPTLRLALVWNRGQALDDVVIEYGERPAIPAPFTIDLPVPPDAAMEPTKPFPGETALPPGSATRVGFGTFIIYEDLNDNAHLDLTTRGATPSPDRVLGVARHIILFYEGGVDPGFHIFEDSPSPDVEDCVSAPCKVPLDSGSALLAAGKPIEIVAVGPHTAERYLCDVGLPPIFQEHTVQCASPPAPGDGLVCSGGGNAYYGKCDPAPGLCEPEVCHLCELGFGAPMNPCAR